MKNSTWKEYQNAGKVTAEKNPLKETITVSEVAELANKLIDDIKAGDVAPEFQDSTLAVTNAMGRLISRIVDRGVKR